MIALVASWVLILLTVFAVSFGQQVITSVRQTRWQSQSEELAALARSGIALGEQILEARIAAQSDLLTPAEANPASPASVDLSWERDPRLRAVRIGDGYVSIGHVQPTAEGEETVYGMEDENRRVPLALLDVTAMQALPGLSPEAVRALETLRADADRFRDLDPRQWPGLDSRSLATLSRLVTTYARSVNVNTASTEVLIALGVPAAGAQKLVAHRNGLDGVRATRDDRLFSTLEDPEGGLRACELSPDEAATVAFLAGRGHLTTRSDVFRVRSRGWVDAYGPWCEIEAVLDRSSGEWEVRSWIQRRNG